MCSGRTEGMLRMKGSDQCALMAELAAAETTVGHGENVKGSWQEGVSSTDGVEGGKMGRAEKEVVLSDYITDASNMYRFFNSIYI